MKLETKRTIVEYLAPCYLGAALNWFAGLSILDWQFYAILAPTLLFANLKYKG